MRDSRRADAENAGKLCLHCSSAVLRDGTSRCPPFWYNIQPMKQKSTVYGKKAGKKARSCVFLRMEYQKIRFFQKKDVFCT